MFDFFQNSPRSDHPPERHAYEASEFADYHDTPYLTALVNLCSMVGVFIGAWTMIILLGTLHDGFARYWSLVLILLIDVAINITVRVLRFRRRRALGLTRAERHRRRRLRSRPPQHSNPAH